MILNTTLVAIIVELVAEFSLNLDGNWLNLMSSILLVKDSTGGSIVNELAWREGSSNVLGAYENLYCRIVSDVKIVSHICVPFSHSSLGRGSLINRIDGR